MGARQRERHRHPLPASRHRPRLAFNIPLHHIRLLICLLSCPDAAVKAPGPLVDVVLSLHPLTADEIGHLGTASDAWLSRLPPPFPSSPASSIANIYINIYTAYCRAGWQICSVPSDEGQSATSWDHLAVAGAGRGYFQGPVSDPWSAQPRGTGRQRGAQVLAGCLVPRMLRALQPSARSPWGNCSQLKSERNVPLPECRVKEKRSARVVEWEEGGNKHGK